MGQCHSDVNSHSGSSLPPTTISERRGNSTQESKPSGKTLSYSSPPALSPRRRSSILCREVITTLSPPQSPDIVVRPRATSFKIKAEEEKLEEAHRPTATAKSTMRFEESIQIEVIDIPSKLRSAADKTVLVSPPVYVAVKTDSMLSPPPPVPFQKFPLPKNDTKKEELVLQVAECEPDAQKDTKMIESAESIPQMANIHINNEAQLESIFKSTLRVMFACYLVGITCFFVMCHNKFTQHIANAPVVGEMDVPPQASLIAKDTEWKDRLHFLREVKQSIAMIGEYSMHQESLPLLSVHAVKELLTGRSEYAIETIQAGLEALEDDVLI